MNAVYEDMTQINDIMTIRDPTLLIEGVALFYKGFQIVSSLKNETYLQALIRLANQYDLFEKHQEEEESYIESFWVKNQLEKQQKIGDSDEEQSVHDLSATCS